MSLSHAQLYEKYAGALAYVAVRTSRGTDAIGTAFHVGEGVLLTARHVVEHNDIVEIATTERHRIPDPEGLVTVYGQEGRFRDAVIGTATLVSGPYFHPDPQVDVAALVVSGVEPKVVPLGSHLDDWLNDEAFVLSDVVVMGYPPIPFSKRPVLVASKAEVNAVIDRYDAPHAHFIVSAVARGGFSGGPCIVSWDFALGLVTSSLGAERMGYMAVVSVEPLLVCLDHHGIMPDVQKEGWDDTWD